MTQLDMAVLEANGFSMQEWNGVWLMTSGPVDKRLCTECGDWRLLYHFKKMPSVCGDCVDAIQRRRVTKSKVRGDASG